MLGVPRPQVFIAFLIWKALFIVWHKVMNGDVVTILQQQLSECKKQKLSVYIIIITIMQEMFKFERSRLNLLKYWSGYGLT